MYLNSKENKRLQQLLIDIPGECNCKSCQALSKEKNKLLELLEELKQTQDRLIHSEKMAALGKLAAGFIHEMNNPIGAIKSALDVSNRSVNKILEILSKDPFTKDIQNNRLLSLSMEALQSNNLVTIKASKRITKILNSLRSFVRLDESPLQNVDLHEFLDSIITFFNYDLNNRIRVVKKYGNIPIITCHAAELNQVFINIFQNSIESIRGKGQITIRTFRENNNVCIQITDTGIGIPPEKIQNLFEPTFSKKETRVKAGMGLFISLNIVKKHHGQIKVNSKVDKGSTFTIILPKNST
ncbi:MAG: GHKL domain-containing protein [Candidatus Aminicenantes bacterium]|nr:GHKL domain-containing protein [Candidatus Aminicenantes bacterium]